MESEGKLSGVILRLDIQNLAIWIYVLCILYTLGKLGGNPYIARTSPSVVCKLGTEELDSPVATTISRKKSPSVKI